MRQLKTGLTLAIAGLAAILMTACGGGGISGGSSSGGGNTNTSPTASAGTAQTVTSGVTVTLNGTASSDSDGTIASYAWSQTAGTVVTLSSSSVAQPTFVAPTVANAAALTFSLVVTDNRGAASVAATVNVTVNPIVGGNVNVTGRVRFARVTFSSSGQRGLNYASPVLLNARGVVVRAINATTQAEIAQASTDSSGNYSLSVPSNTSVSMRVDARMVATGSPSWDIRVQDGLTGNSPYSFTDGPFNSASGVTRNIDIPTGISSTGTATGPRASGPFAALDTVYTAMQTILSAAPATNFPTLVIDWGAQADGTFFSTSTLQHIALLSDLASDTDEFDQHVVAHEFGHYIEQNFSRADNIGGSHGLGDKLDIRVAFGEGFGYAFAAIVLNDPDARDSFTDNGSPVSGGFNIERNPPAPGDPNGTWASESSVWSILYDLYDSGAEAGDTVALGFNPLWNVLTGTQRTTPAFTSIFSFMTALKAARPAEETAINALLTAQNIVAANMDAFGATETNLPAGSPTVPTAAVFPLYTTATINGGPVVARTVNDAGTSNKLGNHRYIRFVVPSQQTITVSLSSSNTNTPDPDFIVWRAGTFVRAGTDPPQAVETETFLAPGGSYVIDAYDCANGCNPAEGTAGDYDLTVTITSP
jgi:hypothetical protein